MSMVTRSFREPRATIRGWSLRSSPDCLRGTSDHYKSHLQRSKARSGLNRNATIPLGALRLAQPRDLGRGGSGHWEDRVSLAWRLMLQSSGGMPGPSAGTG